MCTSGALPHVCSRAYKFGILYKTIQCIYLYHTHWPTNQHVWLKSNIPYMEEVLDCICQAYQPCENSLSTMYLISMFCQYNLGARQYNFLDSDFRDGHNHYSYEKCFKSFIRYFSYRFLFYRMKSEGNLSVNDMNLRKHDKLWIAIYLEWRKISKNGFHPHTKQSVF
jgi:hypothetical protein